MRLLLFLLATGLAVVPAWTEEPAPASALPGAPQLIEMMGDVLDGVESAAPVAETAAAGEPLVLDVRQCVQMTLERNAQVFSTEADVAAREAQHGQARSLRWPQVKGHAGYTYVDGMPVDLYSSGALSFIAGSISAEKYQVNAGFSLEQVLYAGGRIQAAARASKYLARSEAWKREAALAELEFQARQGFHDALLARALVLVAEESVATFERHLADAKQMLEVGLISDFEVLRAQTELGARTAELETARGAERIAVVNLLRILALPQNTVVAVNGKIEWAPLDAPVETLVEEARANRPELRALAFGIEAARQQVAVKKAGYKPSAGARVMWEQVEGGTSIIPEGWTFNVGLEWELMAGGRRKYEVAEANAQLTSLEYQREDVDRLVELDVRQAFLRVKEAIAKIRAEKGTVALGLEGLRMAQLRFQEGVGTQVETLDAELALTSARTQLVRALRDYAVAAAALDKALGRTWSARERPGVDQE